MNAQVMKEVATGVVPAMVAGVIACVLMLLMRKGKPLGDAGAGWVGTLLLGIGCAASAAWAGEGWRPGPGGVTWLPAMAGVACVAGIVRGDGERACWRRRLIVACALMGVAWMTVRSVPDMSWAVRLAFMAGAALVGSAVCWGMAQSVRELPEQSGRGGWPAAAVGLIMGFGVSQVLILVTAVHAAAWVAAGVSAFFGVCLAVGWMTRRPLVGRGVLTAAGVLLCGPMLHGAELGNATRLEAGLFAAALLAGALGPAVAARLLKGRGGVWGGVIACAAPAVAAVAVAAILRPPPLE